MEKNYLVAAIRKLKPNSEFVINNNDYSTIKWDVLEGTAPTQEEVNIAIQEVEAEVAQAEQAKIAAKAQAEAKLAALGLTADEIAALSK